MWPYASKRFRLDEIVGPTRVDVVSTVVSPNTVTSPISGLEAALVRVDVFERVPRISQSSSVNGDPSGDDLVALGSIVLGDLLRLELEGGEAVIELVARRAVLELAFERGDAMPIERALPEIVPLLSRAKQNGVLCQREHVVRSGQRLRLRATVERASRTAAPSDRSAERIVVRDDLAPVLLDEVVDAPGF